MISVGAESSFAAVGFARQAEECGATAVMAIPPVSVAAGEAELARYYRRIIESVSIPVVVQDASGYVGRPMSIAMQARLLDEYGPQRVLYKPEAVPLGPNITALLQATGGRVQVLEGSGGIALVESHARGVVGTMPGADLIDARGAVAGVGGGRRGHGEPHLAAALGPRLAANRVGWVSGGREVPARQARRVCERRSPRPRRLHPRRTDPPRGRPAMGAIASGRRLRALDGAISRHCQVYKVIAQPRPMPAKAPKTLSARSTGIALWWRRFPINA